MVIIYTANFDLFVVGGIVVRKIFTHNDDDDDKTIKNVFLIFISFHLQVKMQGSISIIQKTFYFS